MGDLTAAIRLFRYPGGARPALHDVYLDIAAGEFVVIAGPPGGGKTTLCHCLSGVIPHAVRGEYDGEVRIGSRLIPDLPLPCLAGLTGYVLQVPANQLFGLTVGEDVAFGPENLGLPIAEMLRRRETALAAVGIAHLVDRAPHTLSGGEQQRAVLAAQLALDPEVLIFDQPVAELDPLGRDEVYASIRRLHRQLGKTIVVVEERLSEVLPLATRVVVLTEGRVARDDTPARLFADPAVFDLGLRVPHAVQLGRELRARGVDTGPEPLLTPQDVIARFGARAMDADQDTAPAGGGGAAHGESAPPNGGVVLCRIRDLGHRYPTGTWALRHVGLDVLAGECVAVVGANGAGKSTLARHIAALVRPTEGAVELANEDGALHDIRRWTTARVSRSAGYLFQDPDYQIFADSVFDETAFGLRVRRLPKEEIDVRVATMLDRLGLRPFQDVHPYRLSRGQRQILALASVLVLEPKLLVVDEPSTGLDFRQTVAIMDHLDAFRRTGNGVLLITHDIEMVTRYAQRVVVLDEGRLVLETATARLAEHTPALTAARIRLPDVFRVAAGLRLPLPEQPLSVSWVADQIARGVPGRTEEKEQEVVA